MAIEDQIASVQARKSETDSQIEELEIRLNQLADQINSASGDTTSLENQYNSVDDQLSALRIQSTNLGTELNDLKRKQYEYPVATATTEDKDKAAGNVAADSAAPGQNESNGAEALSADEQSNLQQSDASVSQEDAENQVNNTASVEKTTEATDDRASTQSFQTQTTQNSPTMDAQARVDPVPNPLHAYPSYTYGISWHILSTNDYNTLALNGPKQFKPTVTLVSSASRYHQFRPDNFKDDFYFDNLKLETVIGLNQSTKGTNAIQLSFTIIEPYGLTLLNRMLDINFAEVASKNYTDIPYCLEINFFGYDDQGQVAKLNDLTKIIPIRLLGIKIKAGVKGAEYEVTAVPFSHTAHMETAQATPANFEVTAKSIDEFFAPSKFTAEELDAVRKTYSDTQRTAPAAGDSTNANKPASRGNAVPGARAAEAARPRAPGGGAIATPVRKSEQDTRKANINTGPNSEKNIASPAPTVKVTSYTAAYNAWQQQAVINKAQEFPDLIYFAFDEEILQKGKIVDEKKNPAAKVPVADLAKKDVKAREISNNPEIQASTPALQADFTKQYFNVNAGTTINSLINNVLINSQFILEQIKDPTVSADIKSEADLLKASEKKEIRWFKIIPVVKLGKYDNKRNKYQRITTFYVKVFSYHNSKDSRARQSFPNGYIKEYNYIYTGKNLDIIDFDIDFNTLYYTAINSDLAKTERIGSQATDNSNVSKGTISQSSSDSVTPPVFQPVSDTQGSGAYNSNNDSTKKQSQTVAESFYSSPRGDMLNLKIKIIGDPHFIKQDDVVSTPAHKDYDTSQPISATTNSIVMDSGEIYCLVNFQTPVDIDETTGLLRQDGKYLRSIFSGYYRVMTVTSEFNGGKFTQEINLVRQFKQPGDDKSKSGDKTANQANDENRKADSNLKEATKDVENPAVDLQNPADVGSTTTEVPEKTNTSTETGTITKTTSSSSTVASVSGGGVRERRADFDVLGREIPGTYTDTYTPDSAGPTAEDIRSSIGDDTGDPTLSDISRRNQNLASVAQQGPTEGQDF